MNSRDLSLLAHDVSTLRVVRKHGPASETLLRGLEPKPAPIEPLPARLADLVGLGLLQRTRGRHGGPILFAVTQAGEIALREHDGEAVTLRSVMAAATEYPTPTVAPGIGEPRRYVKRDNYDGAELRPYTGRGAEALRAFTLPSLVNGKRVERTRAPTILASTKPDRLRDGRGRS
jgi:hypothetical protein